MEEERSGLSQVECGNDVMVSALDEIVINQLKHTKPKNKKGRTLKGQWRGYSDATKEYILLNIDWVEKKFDPIFLKQVKN